MLDQHRTHLISTYQTVLQHLTDIRELAVTGKTPGGGKVTPLPEPLRGELLAALSEVAARLEEVVRSFAPGHERALAQPGGPAATRMWISILLRTVEELIQDNRPARMARRYGRLTEEETHALEERVQNALAALRTALHAVDSLM